MFSSRIPRVFALLGDPVAHSLSPAMHNAAFRAAGVDAVYVALRADTDAVAPVLRTIAAAGGGNVTTPHKAAAAAALDRRTPQVVRTGACNTFWREDSEVCGDNTDVAGVRAAIRALAGGATPARVLLLGAGGAAAAAACALLDEGVATIDLINRSPSNAFELGRRLDPASLRLRPGTADRPPDGDAYDLVINATSLGLRADDPLPMPLDRVRGAVLDLVYAPGETAWVRAARARGLPAADGREMLLHQGAAAFERWFGFAAPIDVMRRALEDAAAVDVDTGGDAPATA